MSKQTILAALAGCLVGVIAGFMLANTLNRRAMSVAPPAPLAESPEPSTGSASPASTSLSAEEIRSRVEMADRNPGDFGFQKGLGMSLYRYASLKQDASILPDAIRIMQRALDMDPADRDLQIGLGNAHFDVGYFNKDNGSFERAREFYNQALARLPGDADVRTDLALTYYLETPPNLDTAVSEFEKGLAVSPKHERSLQFLVQTHVKKGDTVKATETLGRLKAANPSNPAIAELTSMIASGSTGTK